MSRDLPQFPNLDHLKKQAKVLLRRLQGQNPGAKLTNAQHAIAREYGFASWAKLKAHVESLPGPVEPDLPAPGGFALYTELARKTIFFARYWAHKSGSPSIDSEHLLLGVVESDEKFLDSLVRHPSSAEDIRREIDRRTTIRQKADSAHTPLSNESKRILKFAAEESARLQHERIGTGHFLLGLLHEEKSIGASVLVDVLARSGIRRDTAQKEIVQILGKGSV